MVWAKLSPEEIRLARVWYSQDNVAPSDIATRLKRDKSTLTRLLCKRAERKPQGRKRSLKESQVTSLANKLDGMIKKAAGKKQVTVGMLKRSARSKVGERTILNALHARNIYFRKMREKPVLTETDIKDRKVFAARYRSKPRAWWTSHLHLTIDVKFFKSYLNGKARDHAAAARVKGVYRAPGQGLDSGYVTSGKRFKQNTGAKGVNILAGVGQDRVLVWEQLPDNKWGGGVAASMYKGPVLRALKRAYPARASFNVLEDNDPSGFKSNKGIEAKKGCGIVAFQIPKRSPVLNVCDYALWDEINRRMRRQEERWPKSKQESRPEYLRRLRRTAMNLPKAFTRKSLQDMKRRCCRLHIAKRGPFRGRRQLTPAGAHQCRAHVCYMWRSLLSSKVAKSLRLCTKAIVALRAAAVAIITMSSTMSVGRPLGGRFHCSPTP